MSCTEPEIVPTGACAKNAGAITMLSIKASATRKGIGDSNGSFLEYEGIVYLAEHLMRSSP
jgi:hypothetical protein